jgi:8-oxo-dGTP pyrophosphatase MutT (NUDIX family)
VKPTLWFDAKHTQAAAGVVLITGDGRLILQLRDDIPTIDNPGMITPFAGGAEPGETPTTCALRELAEETGLHADPECLRFLGEASRVDRLGRTTACVYFLLQGVDPAALRVTEGRAIVMTLRDAVEDARLTTTTRRLCTELASLPPG